MQFTPLFIFCLWISVCHGKGFYPRDEISYEDSRNFFPSCYPNDTCKERTSIAFRNFYDYPCDCDKDCSKFGTCCIDAPYRYDSPPIYKCSEGKNFANADSYYMVPRCPNNIQRNSIWKSLCEGEKNGTTDIFDITPVSSLDTSTTYKNYYCFRCHEATDNFLYWNVTLFGTYKKRHSETSNLNSEFVSVAYNQTGRNWLATIHETDISFPVTLTFSVPQEITHSIIECMSGVISDCAEGWIDQTLRDKCYAYTAVVYKSYEAYKNVHCALCNFKTLDDVTCKRTVFGGYGAGSAGDGISIFQKVLDFRMYEESWCMENHVKEQGTENCKKLSCAIPGFILKNGTCTAPQFST